VTNPNDLVYPAFGQGLTKREYFAAMAMQACVAQNYIAGVAARDAVAYADALIEALNAKEGA
jgi:hypothetical protein